MDRVPVNDVKRAQQEMLPELRAAFERVLGHHEFILGREVAAFEAAWAEFTGSPHAIACSSGTDALLLALLALGIGPGDEVVTAPLTFIATIEAIAACGAKPVLAEVNLADGMIDPAAARAAITPKTKAIIPVHLYGNALDMPALERVADERGILIIEDAAQAHGASAAGKHLGTTGKAGCFSFFPGKNLGALGDAGAVVTGDGRLAQAMREIRDHGRVAKYGHRVLGRNLRMDGLQGAFLAAKLPRLRAWNKRRAEIADLYRKSFAGLTGLSLVEPRPGSTPSHHLFVVRHPRRDWLAGELAKAGIDTAAHYPIPCHLQPAWTNAFGKLSLPRAERFAAECLTLPLFPAMTDDEANRVVAAVRAVLG